MAKRTLTFWKNPALPNPTNSANRTNPLSPRDIESASREKPSDLSDSVRPVLSPPSAQPPPDRAYIKNPLKLIEFQGILREPRVFIDFLIDPKMKLLPEKVKGDMTKEEKEAIQKNNAKKATERAKKAAGLKVKPEQLTKDLMRSFTEYLIKRFTGEGAHTLYARFNKMILAAVEKDIIKKNPCTGVSIKKDYGQLKKEILSQEEIVLLANTHYDKENPDIHRAFIFCLYCGLRWCDVKDLTYANVDYSNKLLKFEQSKTKAHSAASGVVIPLNDGLLHLIGQPKDGNRNQIIFPLPSHTMCLKALRHWVARAGIQKHITWHCARHCRLSFPLRMNGLRRLVS